MSVKPNFLIIGAPRCGTTYLYKNLQSHPEVFMPKQKELHFFDREYHKGIDYYHSKFGGVNNAHHRAIGEATPAYSWMESVPQRIKRHYPDMKFILILRNPIDRAYSHFKRRVATSSDQKITGMSFEQSLTEATNIIEDGKYSNQLARYYELFPRRHFLVLIYEEFMKNPEISFREIYQFLGIDDGYVSPWVEVRINAAENLLGVSNKGIWNILHRVFLNKVSIPGFAKFFGQKGLAPSIGSASAMQDSTRKKLRKEFAESNSRLAALLGRSLSCWER